jgi:hypothetical protein
VKKKKSKFVGLAQENGFGSSAPFAVAGERRSIDVYLQKRTD